MTSEEMELGYLIDVIRRRFWQMALPAAALFTVIAIVVMLLPAKYESSATILIEGQEVPQEMVRSTVSGYVEERLQSIMQVVLNRVNLMSIIDRVGLYQEEREKMTAEALVDMMRKNITMTPIKADVAGGSGRTSTVVVAFSLAFEGKNPSQVLQTTNTLVSLFLEENLKNREEKASTTYTFLEKQLSALRDEITHSEELIARFKEEHMRSLPELTALNLQTLERIDREVQALEENIRGLMDRRVYLEGQLASVAASPQRTLIAADGTRVLSPAEELRILEARYVSLRATHSDKHPDVIKLREQIASMEDSGGEVDLAAELQVAQNELTDARGKYGPSHPDVLAAERRVKALEQRNMDAQPSRTRSTSEVTDNPAWLSLNSQLQAVDVDLQTQRARIEALRVRQDEVIQRLEDAPRVEQEYRRLERDYQNAQLKYQETSQKLMAARESKELEREQVGEKLTLIDPPMLPEVPSKPKRRLLLLVGLVASLGAGAGCGALAEALDGSVRGMRGIRGLTKAPLLGSIPYIATAADMARRRRRILLVVIVAIGVLTALLGAVHVYVRPLDIIFYQVMNRLFGV